MKKQFFLLALFLIVCSVANAQKQKITIDNDTIKVDGTAYGVIEKKNALQTDYTIKSLDGKEQVFFKFQEYNDPATANSANSQGRVTYFEVTFLNSGGKCEVNIPITKKAVAKCVVENNLLKGNDVDPDSEKKMILINGTKFTERRNALNAPTIIIIGK